MHVIYDACVSYVTEKKRVIESAMFSEMVEVEERRCEGLECGKPAKLRCPTCIKLGLKDSFFCDQVGT